MKTRLGLETLEIRDTPATISLVGSTLRIDGSAFNDRATFDYDDRGNWWWWDDQVHARVTNNNGESVEWTGGAGSVSNIQFFGGDGDDVFIMDDLIMFGYGVEAHCGNGNDYVHAGCTLAGSSLFGDAGDDYLEGAQGADVLYGGDGNDRLIGYMGNDYLSGDAGNDRLEGGDDSDLLTGGAGDDSLNGFDPYLVSWGYTDGATDTLYGDEGNDTFVQIHYRTWWGGWTTEDNIMDFGNGGDSVQHCYVTATM